MRDLRVPAAVWVSLWWLWMLLVGEWNHYEWIAATAAATVGATLGEAARRRTHVRGRIPRRTLAAARGVPLQIFVDFGILMWVLVRSAASRRVVRGTWRTNDFADWRSPGARAWASWAATLSPNAIAVEIDRESGTSLVHDLVANRKSELPA